MPEDCLPQRSQTRGHCAFPKAEADTQSFPLYIEVLLSVAAALSGDHSQPFQRLFRQLLENSGSGSYGFQALSILGSTNWVNTPAPRDEIRERQNHQVNPGALRRNA